MDILAELWRRASTQQPVPPASQVWVTALVALALVGLGWPVVRLLTTVVHEAGHAVVASLAGRSLQGIRLHTDTSGLTVTSGRATGPGMVFTFLAGYPAPALFGLFAAWLLSKGYAVGLLWAGVALLALMLVKIRNFYGLFVILVIGAGTAVTSWYLQPAQLSLIGFTVTWVLLLSAPRAALELLRAPNPASDAGQLAQLTRIPAILWVFGFIAVGVLCLLGGVALLLPQVLAAAQALRQ